MSQQPRGGRAGRGRGGADDDHGSDRIGRGGFVQGSDRDGYRGRGYGGGYVQGSDRGGGRGYGGFSGSDQSSDRGGYQHGGGGRGYVGFNGSGTDRGGSGYGGFNGSDRGDRGYGGFNGSDRGGRGYSGFNGSAQGSDRGGYQHRGGSVRGRGSGGFNGNYRRGDRGGYNSQGDSDRGAYTGKQHDRSGYQVPDRGGHSVNGSDLDLHQANQPFIPNPTWEEGSTSSDLSEQFRELSVLSSTSPSPKFPLRPNFGRIGERCRVTANYFLMTIHPSRNYIHHYNVAIEPEIKSKALNRIVMEQLVDSYKISHLGNITLAYDGESSFYTPNPLPFTSKQFKITVPNKDGVEKPYVVKISLVSTIDLQKLRDYVAGKSVEPVQEAIQAIDVVLRQTPTLNFVPVKRSFHSNNHTFDIGGGLEAWSGFYQSVRPTQIGLSLNFDISAAAFVQSLNVTEFVAAILNLPELPRALSDRERLQVKKALKGIKVEVTHRQSGRRHYTISGLTREPTKELTFPFGKIGEIKYIAQYYWETYHKNLSYTSLPCLQVMGNKEILLPMEVCTIVGGQSTKRLNKSQTANMVTLNNQRPRDRAAEITKMVRQNDYARDEYAGEFGIEIAENLASIQARILPSPQLNYGGAPFQPKSGQWNMMKQKLFQGGTVSSWSCLNFAFADGMARAFCDELAQTCITYGMNFNRNPVLPPYRARAERVEHDLKTLQEDAVARLRGRGLDFLIVLLPDNNGSLYGEVKRICETKLGIISQCVLAKTVRTKNPQKLANIVLKINAKVGGINVVLQDALPMVSDRPTIIFGADVTHPSPGEDVSPSIAAVVASQNWPNVTKYAPKFSAQDRGKEMIQDLYRMIREHLYSFVQNNNQQRPERILFYRDGVSEGQFNQVLEEELKAIKQAWSDEFNGSVMPPLTFVVVQKRHHTKIFPSGNSGDRSGNIIAGTVVDSDICHPSQHDFYLCSHAGIKGTSRAAHYHVLWDDNKFSADDLQTLTNNLCYIYARCTRSVSYVSPAYYAHLAAFRARFYLGEDSFSDESSVKGRSSQSTVVPVRQLPGLCENLKNLPFYC